MDGNPHREFFARPTHPHHRRYEALRAVFLDGRPQKEVAEHFGYRYSTLRQLVYEFRRDGLTAGDVPPFFAS
jgi:transposase